LALNDFFILTTSQYI